MAFQKACHFSHLWLPTHRLRHLRQLALLLDPLKVQAFEIPQRDMMDLAGSRRNLDGCPKYVATARLYNNNSLQVDSQTEQTQ